MRFRLWATVVLLIGLVLLCGLLIVRSKRTVPPLKPAKLDPALLVTNKDFDAVLSAADAPESAKVVPIDRQYWDSEGKRVLLEPSALRKLVDDPEPIVWHGWTADGKGIIYSTRDRVCVYRQADDSPKVLLKQAGIKRVYLSPDRERIAVSAGRQLVLIGADGSSYGVHTFASPVLSAAWHPDSRQIACSTAQTMWNIDPSGRLGKLKSYTTMKDSWASDVPQLVPVYAIDSLAWSATGRYLACDVRVHVSKDWNKPYVVAYDTQSGRSKQVDEGFSNGDGYFSWGPAEDWMALAGNEGDADSGVWIRRAWSGDSYQVYGTGTSPQFLQTSWRPGATELALYSSDRISITAEVVAPIYGVQMVDISEARNYGQDSGKLMSDIRRSLKSTPKTRSVESGIPNFDWSSDGAMCVAVSNIYTFRQWNSKPVPDMSVEQRLTGRPLSQIEISLCDGGQRVVWDGQYPEEPRFSPSGDAVSYISGGDLWVREVRTEPRSKERAGYWFKIGSGGFKSGDFAEAVTALRNSIRHQPNSPEAHRMLSDIYVSLARSERNPYRKYMLLSAASFESQNSGSRNASHTDWLRAHVSQIRAERAACSQDEARRPAAH